MKSYDDAIKACDLDINDFDKIINAYNYECDKAISNFNNKNDKDKTYKILSKAYNDCLRRLDSTIEKMENECKRAKDMLFKLDLRFNNEFSDKFRKLGE